MDPRRFDRLAQSLTSAASRRGALVALMAGLVTPFVPDRETAAKRRKRRSKGGSPGNETQHESGDRFGVEKKKGKKKKKKPTSPPASPAPPTCTRIWQGGSYMGFGRQRRAPRSSTKTSFSWIWPVFDFSGDGGT